MDSFHENPPVYVGPASCHDPSIRKGIFNGVGHRLRINSSRTEYFDEAVDVCIKSFALAGYNFQHARTEFRKFRDQDSLELIKKGPKDKQTNGKAARVFFVDYFDPKMPHPRKFISRNYHHIDHNQTLSKLFPRETW